MNHTASLPARDRSVWALFEDWCAAGDLSALPAAVTTLAEFIGANPAAVSTQRRRVSAINEVHRRAGEHPPGHVEQIRNLLNADRATKQRQRAQLAAQAIRALPTTGWPTLLFARRDAVILALCTAGMTFEALARLQIGDVEAAGDHLHVQIEGQLHQTSLALPDMGLNPAGILLDWLKVRALQHHLPSTRALAAYLRGESAPKVAAAPADLPLLTALDRWGAAPIPASAPTARAVREIVTAHVTGTASVHRAIKSRIATDEPEPTSSEPIIPPRLEPEYFSRGINARRLAQDALTDTQAVLDAVEDRADKLLADLLTLLEN